MIVAVMGYGKIEKKVFRRRRKWRSWKKQRNYYLNSLSKEIRVKLHNNRYDKVNLQVTLNVPVIFSTMDDVELVLAFISKCKRLNLSRRHLYLNFKKVERINAGAMSLLLSVVQDLEDLNIDISGNVPVNLDARAAFHESGFLEYVYDEKGKKSFCKSKIIVKGKDKTEQERTGNAISKAMYTVFGIEKFNTAMQGAVIEMMANSVNHAFPENSLDASAFLEFFLADKRWYFSVSHDTKNKKVYFSFIDNGVGILKTIKRKAVQKILSALDNTQILKKAFDGDYKSATRQKERGRGLPRIKDAVEKNAIKDLKVVTNDHMFYFDSQQGVKLTNSFEGTCYFWVLDETCNHGIS